MPHTKPARREVALHERTAEAARHRLRQALPATLVGLALLGCQGRLDDTSGTPGRDAAPGVGIPVAKLDAGATMPGGDRRDGSERSDGRDQQNGGAAGSGVGSGDAASTSPPSASDASGRSDGPLALDGRPGPTPSADTAAAPTTDAAGPAAPNSGDTYVPSFEWTPPPPATPGPGLYVDSVNGDDALDGTTPAKAWRTLANLQETRSQTRFRPGDTIYLARGSEWQGGFEVFSNGTANARITFTSYGQGPLPILRKSLRKASSERIIQVRGDYVTIEGIALRDGFDGAIYIHEGADHAVVRGVEASNVTIGVKIWGEHALVTRSYFHDLVYGSDGSLIDGQQACWGANGVSVNNSNIEISYNVFLRNRGTCTVAQYGGFDGTAIEIDGFTRPKDNVRIHHNLSRECQGFMEVSGTFFRNAVVSHNVSDDYEKFIAFAMGGPWKATVENLRVEHNTVIFTRDADPVFGYWDAEAGAPKPGPFMNFRNNIFYTRNQRVSPDAPDMPHSHNLYFRTDGNRDFGVSAATGDKIGDPLFVDAARWNFRLRAGSPAIDAATNLGHERDLAGTRTPVGAAPDIGAFEQTGN